MKLTRPQLQANSAGAVALEAIDPPGKLLARRTLQRRTSLVQLSFTAPAIVFMVAMFGYPLYYNLSMSFTDFRVGSFLTGVAPFVGLKNYTDLLADSLFVGSLTKTAIFTAFSIAGQMGIGLSLALFFWRPFPASKTLRALLLAPWLLPLVVSATVWRWIYEQDSGVLNYVLVQSGFIAGKVPWLTSPPHALAAVIITNIWIGIPFSAAVFYSGLQALPRELFEAAEIDGANAFQRFWHITLPLLKPLTAIVFMLSVTYTVKVFDLIFVLTGGGPAYATQTLAIYAYELSFRHLDFGHGAAAGNILILISLVFAVFYLRSFRKSMLEHA